MDLGFWQGALVSLAVFAVPATGGAETLEVFHADSLAGPMAQIKTVLERANPGVTIVLTSGRSQELAERILKGDRCDVFASSSPAVDPSKPNTVPDTVRAVAEGKADAGVVYYSAAMVASHTVEVIRFPADVNMAEAIRNAATVPVTAANRQPALAFVKFLLSPEGRDLLEKAGQPPVFPPIRAGAVPPELD